MKLYAMEVECKNLTNQIKQYDDPNQRFGMQDREISKRRNICNEICFKPEILNFYKSYK